MASKVPSLPQTTTKWLLRLSPSRSFSPAFSSAVPTARLHQQGPSRSAVVHEQALPQTQTQDSTRFFTQTKKGQSPPNQPIIPNETITLDTIISAMPLVQSLRQSRKIYKESRPHLVIPRAIRKHHLVGGSLTGPGKLALAPYMWTSSRKTKTHTQTESGTTARASSVISVFHIGRDLCGHPGFVHGGLLSVLFDEVFARCVSAAFPSGLGMTANLNVDFRKPALPDRVYVLKAKTTQVEGRKAWVQGKMTYLPLPVSAQLEVNSLVSDAELLSEESEGAVMVSEARALFVEPKFADVSIFRG